MAEYTIINNTAWVRHLPYGGVLQPGKNEVDKEVVDRNCDHPGIQRAIKAGNLVWPVTPKKPEPVENKGIEEPKGEAETYPKDNGGGWYTLSNGDSVQGKAKALDIEEQLQGGE